MATKFFASLMVLNVVSNEGGVVPRYIFSKGLKVSTEEYLKVPKQVVRPWMDRVAAVQLRVPAGLGTCPEQ
jgi:hypothetical protein